MRVLVVHNKYRSALPSGENLAVADECQRLAAAGIDVHQLVTSSDDIRCLSLRGKLGVAAGPVHNPDGVREFKHRIADVAPDIIQIHNVYPMISPAIIAVAKRARIPIVHTVHNYRHTCLSGLHTRDSRACDSCYRRSFALPGVVHGCYRGSRAQSVAMAIGQVVHRSTWRNVNAVLTMHEFLKARLVGAGISPDRIHIVPTTIADPGPPAPLGRNVLFVGRLEAEKGCDLLLAAWQGIAKPPDTRLRIAGTGPLEHQVAAAALSDPTIDYLGRLGEQQLRSEYREAVLVALPSRAYEGQPRVLIEAFAHGRPVVSPSFGGIAASVTPETAWTAEGNASDWRDTLAKALNNRKQATAKASAARRRYLAHHAPDTVTSALVGIYRSTLKHNPADA